MRNRLTDECRRERAVTLNYGMKMPAWYDIVKLEKLDGELEETLQEARNQGKRRI